MVNIAALMKALPVSDLEPNAVALIGGLIEVPKDLRWRETFYLLEPPAGQHAPYIKPVEALEKLLRSQGASPKGAQALARKAVARMMDDVAENHWVNFFDYFEPESPECLPVADFLAWLRNERQRVDELAAQLDEEGVKELASSEVLIPPDITNFIEHAAEVSASTPMFRGPDNWDEPWSLKTLPAMPPPKAMINYLPGPPWAQYEDGIDWRTPDNPFMRWREAIRPVALELEKALGEPVYYFADLDCDTDDDDVHRFLVLHWCCTFKPESAYVRYLLKVSGAKDVEELKAALIDPASYTHPFKMNCSFLALEARFFRIDYLPPDKQKTVAVLFSTPQARDAAQYVLAERIGTRAIIIAPEELATVVWVKQATHYCRDWEVRYLRDDTLNEPIEILALADELCVIANDERRDRSSDLMLSEGAEDLLWLALELGIDTKYFHVDCGHLQNPETSLEKRGAPARVAIHKAQRADFTQQLKEIRLANDYGSNGLWDEKGDMLGYDALDLPFPLVRRIAAWQRDYDDTVTPPDDSSDDWWDQHTKEEIEIAKLLRATLSSDVTVKLYCRDGLLMTLPFSAPD